MAENTKIEWVTNSANPWMGCQHATSPGTDNPHPGIEWRTYNPVYDDDLELRDKKGGDPLEWPEDLRVRQFPEVLGKGVST